MICFEAVRRDRMDRRCAGRGVGRGGGMGKGMKKCINFLATRAEWVFSRLRNTSMKITGLIMLISISTSMLGLAAAANSPKVLPRKDVPEVVRAKADQEAGVHKVTKYKQLENGNIVADSGNGKNRKMFEYTPTGTYIGYSQPMTETKLPDVIRKHYINTMEKKDCPTCPLVLARISTLVSVEKVTPAGSSTAVYRCKGSLKGTITTTDYDESGKVLK